MSGSAPTPDHERAVAPGDGGTPATLAPAARLGAVCCAVTNLTVLAGWLAWMVRARDRGLDASDEGYYLSAVEYPWSFPHAPTDFAFVLRPAWLLVGRDVGNYRLVGMLLLVGCGSLLGWTAARRLPLSRRSDRAAMTCWFVGMTGLAALSAVDIGLLTPNYNTLTASLLMLLLAVAATLLRATEAHTVLRSGVGPTTVAALGAIGGFVCWFLLVTKSTAGVVAVVVMAGVVVGRSWPVRGRAAVVRAVGIGWLAGVLVHAVLIGGRVGGRVAVWRDSATLSGLRRDRGRLELLQWDYLSAEGWSILLHATIVVLGLWLLRRWRTTTPMADVVGAGCLVVVVAVLSLDLPDGGWHGLGVSTGMWWIRVSVVLIAASVLAADRVGPPVVTGVAVLVTVLGSAFGSNNGVISQVHFFGGALIGGALLMTSELDLDVPALRQVARLTPFFACALLVPLGVSHALTDGLEEPYRLEGARADADEPSQSGTAPRLLLHPGMADLAAWLEQASSEWTVDPACVVNLEGGTPVIEFLLGVPPAGSSWDLGAYPGSDAAAAEALDRDDCWTSSDFVLVTSPDGARRMSVPSGVADRCAPPSWALDWETATGRHTLELSECPFVTAGTDSP